MGHSSGAAPSRGAASRRHPALPRGRHGRAIAAILAGALGFAAVAARADDQSRLQVARDVVKTAHMADTMRVLFPTLLNQMRPMLVQQGASNATVDELFKRFGQRLDREIDNFNDLSAQVYAREFSEDDLANLLKFYQSPTGQRLIGKQPVIAQAMAGVGADWGRNMAEQVIEEFRKERADKAPKL